MDALFSNSSTHTGDTPLRNAHRPSNVEEIRAILHQAKLQKTPIYIHRDSGQQGLHLVLTRMNKVLETDTANLVAGVEPGVRLGDLSDALIEHRLRFVPAATPFLREKTVGQFFYEGCSNIASLKYGPAKHFLMGADILLPDGKLIKTGGKTVKNVTGYDLTRFMNGPYANLGIPVKFLLKLLPEPEAKRLIIARFTCLEDVFGMVDALRSARIVPAYLFWFDPIVQSFIQKAAIDDHLVLVEVDGVRDELNDEWQAMDSALRKSKSIMAAEAPADIPEISSLTGLFNPEAGFSLVDELKLRYSDQPKFMDFFYGAPQKKTGIEGLFGQIAEGKIHAFYTGDPTGIDSWVEGVLMTAKKAGGFISGNYHRSLGKAPQDVLGQVEQTLKACVDPDGILMG